MIGVCLLLELLARGENRLFSPEKVRPICFCGTKKEKLSAKRTAYKYKSFACGESRLKSKKKSRLAGKLNSERFAARAPRITTSVKQERLSDLFSLNG